MNIVAALRTPRADAVEMPPRGKRGKLKEQVSHPSHRAWKSGTGQPDSHISTAPAADLLIRKETRKDEKKTEFQLTDSITSSTIRTPASLRSENDQLHLGTSDWDPIGITEHLHRNTHAYIHLGISHFHLAARVAGRRPWVFVPGVVRGHLLGIRALSQERRICPHRSKGFSNWSALIPQFASGAL
jgi:hypothetical protein